MDFVTLDRTGPYDAKAAKLVRGQVRGKGGSDPLFSPGLRPEKHYGVAPALVNPVMLDAPARVPRVSSIADVFRRLICKPKELIGN